MMGAILTTISTLLPQAIAVIQTTVPKILPWIINSVKQIGTVIGKYLPAVLDVIDSVTDILDIIDRNRVNSEELGRRSMEAEKSPEDFDDISSYIKYLQDEITLDNKEFTETEQLAQKMVGGALSIRAVEEKVQMNTSPDFWLEVARNKLLPKEIMAILNVYKNNEIDLDFSKFCKGELDYNTEKERGNMLVNTFKELYPDLDSDTLEDKVMQFEKTTTDNEDVTPYEL